MCRTFTSTSPPAGLGRLLPLMAVVQGIAAVSQEWRMVETLRETRLVRELEFRRDRAQLRVRLKAFEAALATQVGLEQTRANAFGAAMAAIMQSQDREATIRVLEMARDILGRTFTLPAIDADGGY